MRSRVLLMACLASGWGMAQPARSAKFGTPGTKSFLGIGIQEIDAARAAELKLPETLGVEVTRVEPDSPADQAGLKTGDVVVQYNGQKVEGIDQFSRMVRDTPPGREVKIDYFRNGARQTATAKIVARSGLMLDGQLLLPGPSQGPSEFQFPDLPRNLMAWRSVTLGIEAEGLSGQLAEFFGVKEGVLVRSVTKGSAAEKAGIKAGDVITRVDEVAVATPADISVRLRLTRNRSVAIMLTRDHKEMSVTVSFPERSGRTIGSLRPFLEQASPRVATRQAEACAT